MPMIDLFAPQGALPADALSALAARIVGAVHAEKGYTGSRFAASVSWTYAHEVPTARLLMGTEPCRVPIWRVEVATPGGSLDAGAKARLGREVARLVLAAEGTAYDAEQAGRIWCLFRDVPEGEWFAGERAASSASIRAHSVDSTHVRAHRCASGAKGGTAPMRWAARAAATARRSICARTPTACRSASC